MALLFGPAPRPAAAILTAAPPRAEIRIEDERRGDEPAREALLDEAFGPRRFAKTSERLRAGRPPAEGLSLVAKERGASGRRSQESPFRRPPQAATASRSSQSSISTRP